jgi:hypothetical protein
LQHLGEVVLVALEEEHQLKQALEEVALKV